MTKAIPLSTVRGLIVLMTLWICNSSYGQIYKYLGLEDGLSSRNVYAVEQSNGGFMWFLTDNGIDRYDGTSISKYTIKIAGQKFTEYSTSRLVHDPVEDNLWMVTGQGRVVRYNKRINGFETMYSPQIKHSKADISECAVSPIDDKGNIWIFIGDEAFLYNVRTLEGKCLNIRQHVSPPTYSAVVKKDSTTLYIGTNSSVYKGIIRNDQIILEAIPAFQNLQVNVNILYYSKQEKTLLIGTEDAGIIAYKEKQEEIIYHKDILQDVRVTEIIPINGKQEVLFSTNAVCVYRMSLKDCFPLPYLRADFTTDYRMNADNVSDICLDTDGQLWMCSFPKGMTIRNEQYPEFKWIRRSFLSEQTLIDNGIDCILEDSEKDLWYATDNGISLYEIRKEKWHTILSQNDESGNLNNFFLTICEVRPGTLLVGGYAAGIYIIDKASKQARFVKPDLIYPEKYIQTMYIDPSDNSIWMGGENQLFNVSYNETLNVNYVEVFRGINYITQKDKEHLWVGTKDGLYIFNKNNGNKRRVELPLEHFRVNTIFHDTDGTIYIGTHHHGLIVYNEEDNYYKRYTKDNSALTNDCMKCIVNAGNNSLFISSDDGIVRFNKTTEKITTWTKDQGLQDISFNIRSGIYTHRKTMMFGGDNGVIEIHEEGTLPHIYKSTIVLSDLYIGSLRVNPDNEDSPISNALDETHSFELNNDQRNAAIHIKNINHIYPSDCKIIWTFDEYDKEGKENDNRVWHPLNEDNLITLNSLPTGRHILTIRSVSNESGILLDERVIAISINPPFYLSLVGLGVEFALIIIILIFIIQFAHSANTIHTSNEKINFLVNTAHDIRTPLTLIKAPLEELCMKDTLSNEEREAVNLALRNANTLTEMTENAMHYEMASIEKGKLRVECHEAIAHFQSVINRLSVLAQTKKQRIVFKHPENPFHIWVDAYKLSSIIQNLLSNAFKYSSEGEDIILELYREEKVWGFHIIDNGIGIKDGEKHKLFKQFFRGSNAVSMMISGSGMGLFSINNYVKQMKGKIEVKSQLNKGSDFHLQFPLGKSHYNPHDTDFLENRYTSETTDKDWKEMPAEEEHRTRLLIVEDNPDLLTYLSRIFSKDYKVYTATNGKEALSKIPYVHPMVVLTDIMMPEMRGDDLCVSIKSNIDTSHIAVVLISALSDQQSIVKGLSVKADAYITKPFDIQIMEMTLRNLVENRQLIKQRLSSLDEITEHISESTSELDLKLLKEMRDIIEKNIANPELTVDTLAYDLRVSRTSLYNKIKVLTGHTPADYIRLFRINKAKTLLNEGHHTITEITDLVGFSDPKHFREVFKKSVGMTPSEYAKKKNTEK